MKNAVILSILLLCAGIVLFSCGKSTGPIMVDHVAATLTVESRDMIIGGIQYRIDITIDSLASDMIEARFSIGFDKRCFSFMYGSPGDFMMANDWQFDSFEYIGSDPLAGDTNIGIVAIHIIKNASTASIQDTTAPQFYEQLYQLTFRAVNDESVPVKDSPIRFYWNECTSNLVYFSDAGEPAQISAVRDAENNGLPIGLPDSWRGPSSGCDSLFTSLSAIPGIALVNGLETIRADTLADIRGNINMSGYAYEIADAVMLTNYFLFDLAAFGSHADSSVLASDVNINDIQLELADLTYLIRYIIGEALPPSELEPSTSSCELSVSGTSGNITVDYDCPEDLGAIYMQFRLSGLAGQATINNNMDVFQGTPSDSIFSLMITNIGSEYLPAGQHELVEFPVSGTAELISAEASSYEGVNIPVVIQK